MTNCTRDDCDVDQDKQDQHRECIQYENEEDEGQIQHKQ